MYHRTSDCVHRAMTRYIGQVKFFGKKGYGFITAVEGQYKDIDFFVHHTAIKPSVSTYRVLRRGEYVHFEVVDSASVPEKQQAQNVTGIFGYPLMCDIQFMAHQEASTAGSLTS
jgi:cold shock CspA family protein